MHLRKKRYGASKSDIKKYTHLISSMHKSGNFINEWLKLSTNNKLKVFTLGGLSNRVLIDKIMDRNLYNNLQHNKLINQLVFRALKENLPNTRAIVFNTKPIIDTKISYNNLLKLGFKSLKSGSSKMAAYFFYSATFNATTRFYKDKAIFWLYMATKNINNLERISKSYDYNIYKLIALDMLHKPYPLPPTLSSYHLPYHPDTYLLLAKLYRLYLLENIFFFNLAHSIGLVISIVDFAFDCF